MNFNKLEKENPKEYNERIFKEISLKPALIENINNQIYNFPNTRFIEREFSKANQKDLSIKELSRLISAYYKNEKVIQSLMLLLTIREYIYTEINLGMALAGVLEITDIGTNINQNTDLCLVSDVAKALSEIKVDFEELAKKTAIEKERYNNTESIIEVPPSLKRKIEPNIDDDLELRRRKLVYGKKLKYWEEILKTLQKEKSLSVK